MDWQKAFKSAVASFRSGELGESLRLLDQAIQTGGDKQYLVYDSRAAVFEKQGNVKSALRDSKKVIELAPQRWHGYVRAARLFSGVHKFDQCISMADAALQRLPITDVRKRSEVENFKETSIYLRRRTGCHIGKLPVELLTEIFATLNAERPDSALVVSHVCQRWRQVALNAPYLWGALLLPGKDPLKKTHEYVSRSKGKIRVLSLPRSLRRDTARTQEILGAIHWHHVRSCTLQDLDLWSILDRKFSQPLCLERLEISDLETAGSRDAILALPHAPLRHLSLDSVQCNLETIHSHHSHLYTLSLRHIHGTFGDFLSVLQKNPLLTDLTLDAVQNATNPASAVPEFVMQNVVNLNLVASVWTSILFKYVIFPALQTLSISRWLLSIDSALRSVQDHTSGDLRTIHIDSCVLSASELIAVLRRSPLLESLTLLHLHDTANEVVEALASSTPTPDVICPSLKHLNVSHCPDVRTGPLVRLVESRATMRQSSQEGVEDRDPRPAVVAELVSLKADGCHLIEAAFIPWLRERVPDFSCIYMSKKAAKWRR